MDHTDEELALVASNEKMFADMLLQEEAKRPAAGPRRPLADLEREVVAVAMLRKLRAIYRGELGQIRAEEFRRIRGDGCCFYRSVLFVLFEWMMKDEHVRYDLIAERIELGRQTLLKLGYREFAIEDVIGAFDKSVELLRKGGNVEDVFDDVRRDKNMITLARLLTSAWIRSHADEFMPFITSHSTADLFCAETVDPMWRDADDVHITALMRSLQLGVRIVYLDSSSEDPNVLEIPGGTENVCGTLLYRPGHYDVLYLRE